MLKGALVVFETTVPIPTNLIMFQYNPDQVARTLRAARRGGGDPRQNAGDTQNVLAPTERLKLAVELDAADQLEEATRSRSRSACTPRSRRSSFCSIRLRKDIRSARCWPRSARR